MEQRWKVDVTLYRTEDGEMQYDHDGDGVEGVGDIYALHRVNQFYEALQEDEGTLSDEGKEIMQKAKALNEELIAEIGNAIFQQGEDGEKGEG